MKQADKYASYNALGASRHVFMLYITSGLKRFVEAYMKRTGAKKADIYERAIVEYLSGNTDIPDVLPNGKSILQRRRSAPDYIRRSETDSVWIDDYWMERLKELKEEKGYNLAQMIYWALALYCMELCDKHPELLELL